MKCACGDWFGSGDHCAGQRTGVLRQCADRRHFENGCDGLEVK